MRVFAAIPLPDDVVTDLSVRVTDVAPGLPDDLLRWTQSSSWHLTLAFFGSMADDEVADLRRRLSRTSQRHAPLTLSLAGSGHFGRRVLWTGVRGDVDPLRRLARSVTAAGRRAGANVDDQARYRPHLTLARAVQRGDDDPAPVRAAVADAVARLRDYAGPTWLAPSFVLMRSDLGQGAGQRARHTVLEMYDLSGPA